MFNKRHYNSETLQLFLSEYKNFKELNSKQFLKWISELAKFRNVKLIKERDHLGRYFELEKDKIEEAPF